MSNQAFELCASEEKRACCKALTPQTRVVSLPPQASSWGPKQTNPRRRSAHSEITAFCLGKDRARGPGSHSLPSLPHPDLCVESLRIDLPFNCLWLRGFSKTSPSVLGGVLSWVVTKKLAELQNNDLSLNTGSLGSLTRGSADGACFLCLGSPAQGIEE